MRENALDAAINGIQGKSGNLGYVQNVVPICGIVLKD